MSDPRNVAHAKKVTQEKKHHGADAGATHASTGRPGKKAAAMLKKHDPAGAAAAAAGTDTAETAPQSESPTPTSLEGSLVVLAKLKEMEFHSRGNLERLAELVLTVGDELKQQQMVSPLDEVYSAQNVFQTKLTALIEAYQTECDRIGGTGA